MKPKNIATVLVITIFAALFAIWVSGCVQPATTPAEENVMKRISSRSFPDFTDDMAYDGLEHSLLKSLSYFQKIPIDRQFAFGKDRYTTEHLIRSLQYFLDFVQTRPTTAELNKFIRSNYLVYRSVGRNGRGEVLYTGYYEPNLRGSLTRSENYRFPIYARPQDLISIDLALFSDKYAGEKIIARYTDQNVLPYYDRSEIDSNGILEGNTEVLAWVEDPIDVFFLQIQGSGKIYLDNGEVLNVHYNTSNGRP